MLPPGGELRKHADGQYSEQTASLEGRETEMQVRDIGRCFL